MFFRREVTMKSTAPLILIVAGFGFPQQSPGQTPTHPAPGTFQDLPGLGKVQAINNTGQIAGQTGGGDEVQGLLTDLSGNITVISVPGSEQTLIYGMDNSTRIVGAYNKRDHGGAHGFLYVQGAFTTLDYPGGTDTRARAINDPGQIVGDYNDSTGHRHGFLYAGGSYTPINVSGAVGTYVYGISSSGNIVGYYTDSQGHQHGFLSSAGSITTVNAPFPGATDTFLYGINALGIIVGSYIDNRGTHAFVDVSGIFVNIDAPETLGGIGTFGRSINDNGFILIYSAIAHLTGVPGT